MQITKTIYNKLLKTAKAAFKNSYSPYSKYRVAAALLAKSGKIYGGTNIENASYGLSMCAERCAIFKAVSEGEKEIKAILIIVSQNPKAPEASPCGACRQVIAEFARPDTPIYIYNLEDPKKPIMHLLKEYLPYAFTPKNLE